MRNKKQALFRSIVSLMLCFSMLMGTTYAWFTDSVTSANNIIAAGTLDVELEYLDGSGNWQTVDASTNVFDPNALWEPGHTEVVYLRLSNAGDLALNYRFGINVVNETGSVNQAGDPFKLSDYIRFGVVESDAQVSYTDRFSARNALSESKIISNGFTTAGQLYPVNNADGHATEKYVALVVWMPEDVGNVANYATGMNPPQIKLGLQLVAGQQAYESDDFGTEYDNGAVTPEFSFPVGGISDTATGSVTTDGEGKVDAAVTLQGAQTSATIPAGVQLENGTSEVTLSVATKSESESNLTLGENEEMKSLDVHVTGVAQGNTVAMIIDLGAVLPVGLNQGNYALHHVENGATVAMTAVATLAELDAHNEFYYDPATGNVTIALASFSEVAFTVDKVNAWVGKVDHSWYDAKATELTIANADQLWSFSQIVGGMAKAQDGNFLITYKDSDGDEHHNDTFSGKTVKLIANINLGDAEKENNPDLIFYPIGYWNSEGTYEKSGTAISSGFYTFQGTFDGNGNTISNFYQNTWEMKGDHDWYDAELQYFRDGMGLFGRVYGGTIKNVIVDNFSCDSEIGTTGVIAAYADSKDGQPAIFENITITNCNPRVYNIGNGGIVGCAGWYSRNESLGNTDYTNAVTFRNITVDQTNKISALWGSWGVSCGGILGQYYPDSSCGIKMENCHVAAIIDVNNDVCSNYQYYWYRYAGMFIGTIRKNTTDTNGNTVADTTGVFAKDCTYTMGTWNEYWYCEIVANSLASYTHDHQFSRLDNIYSLSEIQDENGNWNTEGHFALLDENRDIVDCYHIFKNSEGNLYRHFHDVADESNPNIYEDFDLNGDGKLNDLKEDRQRYFIPFNQLLTGLDMGIKAHTVFEGITFVEDGAVKSEPKFEELKTLPTYRPGQTIKLGDIVKAVVDETKIAKATLYATVSPAIDNNNTNVSATYSLNLTNWEDSTITFGADCSGAVKIVINDYFYCTPTVIVLNEEGKSEKFTANSVSAQNAYTQITLGDLFGVKGSATIGNVTATVTDPNSNEIIVSGTNSDWASKTIDLTKDGEWTVTIKDDDAYCAATTRTFTVNKADKFTKKFDKDFLYRVGNEGTVSVGTIIGEIETAVKISSVDVTIVNVAGNAAGKFTSNATWKNGTIQFSGTGVVKVTISTDGAIGKDLYLEVVDAVNATSAISATNDTTISNRVENNVVLLNNISGGFTVSDGYAFYGNGFKVICSGKGTYLNNGGLTLGYVNVQTGGILDNVQVICDIYPNAFVYAEEVKVSSNLDKEASTSDRSRYMYQLSAIAVSGDGSVVANCYAYGGRNNIFVGGGNVTIENTVTECGTLANIQIAGVKDTAVNTVTLKDVTTIQYKNASTYDSTKIMLGFGIVVGDNESTKNPYIVLQGDLKQYNWVTSDDTSVSNTYAKTAIEGALAVTQYQHTIKGKTAVNMGIAYMNTKTTAFPAENDQRTNKQTIPYVMESVRIGGQSGYVYSIAGSDIDGTSRYNAEDDGITPYKANAQRDVVPKPVFALGDQTVTGEDRYLTGDINGITGRYESGQNAFTLDITKLMSASKYGTALTVNAVCIDPDGNKLTGTVTLNKTGTYTLMFTVVDTIFYYLEGEQVVRVDKTIEYTYTVSIKITIAEPSVPDAILTVKSGSFTGKYTDSTADGSKKLSINPLDAIEVTDAGVAFTLTSNVKDVNITYAATGTDGNGNAFGGTTTITVTYNEGQVLKIVLAKPTSNSPGNPKSITYDSKTGTVKSSNTLAKNSCTAATWAVSSYSFTGKNGKTVTVNGVEFSIAADTSGGGCVTGDTLVMLADGTQKRVDALTGEESLIVWDFYKGEYTVSPVGAIVNHGYADVNEVTMLFADGTTIKTIYGHGFYDVAENKFVIIDENNINGYIGHEFIRYSDGTNSSVVLVDYNVETTYAEAWTLVSAIHFDCILNGMLTLSPTDFENSPAYLMPFEIGEGMKYDEAKMQADIEKYGQYTYEDFAEYCTYEQFVGFAFANWKIGVEKGYITFEDIIYLINTYVN